MQGTFIIKATLLQTVYNLKKKILCPGHFTSFLACFKCIYESNNSEVAYWFT